MYRVCLIAFSKHNWHSVLSLNIGTYDHLYFYGKSITWGVVGSNNFALGWCQWLPQVQITFIIGNYLEVKVIWFLSRELERVPFFSKKCMFDSIKWFLVVLGCLRCSIVVDPIMPSNWISFGTKCQILVQLRCWESEVAWLTNQEDGKWASCLKPPKFTPNEVGSTKSFNRSTFEFPTCYSNYNFFPQGAPSKLFIVLNNTCNSLSLGWRLKVAMTIEINPKVFCIHELSQFGHHLGRFLFVYLFSFNEPKITILALDKLISRLIEMQSHTSCWVFVNVLMFFKNMTTLLV